MKEKTLVLLKPDAVQRGLVGEIIKRFENVGLKIIAMKMRYADEELSLEHYAKDDEWFEAVGKRVQEAKGTDEDAVTLGKEVQQQLAGYLAYSPIIALVLEGHQAVKLVRKHVGEQSPEDSAPGTIRGDYSFDAYALANSSDRPLMNLVHASGSVEEAKKEIGLWFEDEEIHAWKRIDEDFLYMQGV